MGPGLVLKPPPSAVLFRDLTSLDVALQGTGFYRQGPPGKWTPWRGDYDP